jgi:hypothetical protein
VNVTDSNHAPRVSFLLAVHNDARFVGATLASMLGQTFGDFEIVAIDDASTDGTADILRSAGDARIRYFRNQTNLGQVPSLNRGLALCRGEAVARIDGDDVCEPQRLAAQVKYLDDHPDISGCGTWTTEIDAEDRVIGGAEPYPDPDYVRWSLCHTNWLYHPSMTLRREVFEEAGGYDVAYPACEDYELWTRIVAAGHRLGVVPQRLIRYRRRPGSLTAMYADNQRRVGHKTATRYIRMLIGDPCDEQTVTLMRMIMSWEQFPAAGGVGEGESVAAGSAFITANAKAVVGLMYRIRRATIAHAAPAPRAAADADAANHLLRRGRVLLRDAPGVSAVLGSYIARLPHHRLAGLKLFATAVRCLAGRWRRSSLRPS